MAEGKLYICGTPIGNLQDITYRAVETLQQVDLVAAEDTRRTKKLLNYYEINTSLTSYHEHNASQKKEKLAVKLAAGQQLALVSDAGMPGISDPGYELVKLVREEGVKVIPIPGPTAMTSALVVSGLPTDKFVFEGFLPRKKERKRYLRGLEEETRTMVFYESAQRIVAALEDIKEVLGNRKVAVCRELTKKFEEVIKGSVREVVREFELDPPKGEITLVVEGGQVSSQDNKQWRGLSILEHIKQEMEQGLTKKKAIKQVAKIRDLPKSEVYKIGTKIRVNK